MALADPLRVLEPIPLEALRALEALAQILVLAGRVYIICRLLLLLITLPLAVVQ
jgi:hypothetical protein